MQMINRQDIKKYLRSFAHSPDPGIQQKLGNYLIAALFGPLKVYPANLECVSTGELFYTPASQKKLYRFAPDPALDATVRHIADWIKAAMVNREGWLDEKDEKGIPLTLRSIRSVEQATAMADAAMTRIAAAMDGAQTFWLGHEEEVKGYITPEMVLEGGYRVVRLRTPEALDRESAFLGHCIGQGAYDEVVSSDRFFYYSLRDSRNIPRATFEVDITSNTLLQCKGVQNEPPVEKYFTFVHAFVKARGFKLFYDSGTTGLLERNGEYYDVFNLPKAFYCDALTITNTKRPLKLPNDLNVLTACLYDCAGLAGLPDNFTVRSSLNLKNCFNLLSIPASLKLGGALKIFECNGLIYLPENFAVPSHFVMIKCQGITRLPYHLSVRHDLVIAECPGITALPEKLSIGLDLDLAGCEGVTVLPKDLAVGQDFNIRGCPGITALPDNLSVKGNIITDFGTFSTVDAAREVFLGKCA